MSYYVQAARFREYLRSHFPLERPRMVTFASGKGGVGKTLLAANFAFSFAERGVKTLLIDGDCGLANQDIALGVFVKHTLEDVCQGKVSLEEALVRTRYPYLTLLPASSGVLFKHPDSGFIRNLVQSLASWDLIVIDAPAGLNDLVINWGFLTYWTIMVLNQDKTSLADAYALIKVFKQHQYSGVFQVIANQVSSDREGLQVFEGFSKVVYEFLSLPIGYLGSVPDDPLLKKSINTRRICSAEHPFSPSAQAIRKIVAAFCTIMDDYTNHHFYDSPTSEASRRGV